MPGTLTLRVFDNALALASWPIKMFSITRGGLCTHILVSGAVGQIASTPASGSRMMPLAKLDAALLALPGRTLMVGDTTHDLQLAENAGSASIGVTYGAHEIGLLQAHQPLTLVDSVSALRTYLEIHA